MSQVKDVVVVTKSKSRNLFNGLGLLGFSVMAMNGANAADALDTTALVATVGGASVAVAALATASLTVYVGIKVFKWIKTAV